MYLQTFLGARFMLPLKYRKKELYKSKRELLTEKPDSRNEECSICLKIFTNNSNETKEENKDNETSNDNDNESNKNNNNIEVRAYIKNINIIEADSRLGNDKNKNKKKIKESNKKDNKDNTIKNYLVIFLNIVIIIIKSIKSIILDGFFTFYKAKINKEFILLPCGHFYHSLCFKEWFKEKKECCVCRAKMSHINLEIDNY